MKRFIKRLMILVAAAIVLTPISVRPVLAGVPTVNDVTADVEEVEGGVKVTLRIEVTNVLIGGLSTNLTAIEVLLNGESLTEEGEPGTWPQYGQDNFVVYFEIPLITEDSQFTVRVETNDGGWSDPWPEEAPYAIIKMDGTVELAEAEKPFLTPEMLRNIVGGTVFAIVIVVAALLIRSWRSLPPKA